METKEEFYTKLIQIQKECGQGLSGIIKVFGPLEYTRYLDEFIEEGLVVANDTDGSIWHPENNIFYTPIHGYNVWNEEYPMMCLTFVRKYLNIPDEFDEDNSCDDEFMAKYNSWLEINKEQLEIMSNLEESYEKALEIIKSEKK